MNPSLIREVKPTRLFEGVMMQIHGLIAQGHLSSGDRLPPEKQLCAMFGVSRTSIREALRGLGALGLIEVRNGAGSYVKRGSPEAMGAILSMVLFHDVDDIPQIYEARRFIETWTTFYAADRATNPEIASLERLVEKQARRVEHGEAGIEEDFQFHLEIAKAARNEVITRLLYSMITLIFKVLDPAKRPPRDLTVAVEQHRRILEAIRGRDGWGAMQETWSHISYDAAADGPLPLAKT